MDVNSGKDARGRRGEVGNGEAYAVTRRGLSETSTKVEIIGRECVDVKGRRNERRVGAFPTFPCLPGLVEIPADPLFWLSLAGLLRPFQRIVKDDQTC